MHTPHVRLWYHGFVLFLTLIPILIAQRWVASNLPTSIMSSWNVIQHLKPGKLALFVETYHERHRYNNVRIFVMDFERDSMRELCCPATAELMWESFCGVDTQGNVICRLRKDHKYDYFSITPTTGEIQLVASGLHGPIIVGDRYLVETGWTGESSSLLWLDLEEVGYPVHSLSRGAHDATNLTNIPQSAGFYVVESARTSESESLDSDPAFTDNEMQTLVLMGMHAGGPVEVTRWPVIGGSGYVTYMAGLNCVVSQSNDRKYFDIHDASTGLIRCQIPIPSGGLDENNKIENWSVGDTQIHIDCGAGGNLHFDLQSGSSIANPAAKNEVTVGGNADEILTMSWDNVSDEVLYDLHVQNRADGRVLFDWPVPDRLCTSGLECAHLGDLILLPTQDGRVLFVDKTNGHIERTFHPHFWVPYCSCIVILASLVWVFCWLRFSVQNGFTFWIDVSLIASIASLFLWWRITLSGHPKDLERLEWTCVAAGLIAIGNVLIHETLHSRRGLILRVLPTSVFAVGLFLVIRFKMGPSWSATSITIQSIAIGSFLLLGSLGSSRICPSLDRLRVQQLKPFCRLTLKELLFVTFVCAAAMASLRWINISWSLEILQTEWLALCVLSLLSLIMYCIAVRGSMVIFKLLLVAALLVATLYELTVLLPSTWHYSLTYPEPIHSIEFAGGLAIATILLTLPIGIRRKDARST